MRINKIPKINLSKLSWDILENLGFRNVRNEIIRGAQGWGKKFMGNFIETEDEIIKFAKLVELKY